MGSTSDVSRWNPRDPFADTSPRSGGKERSGTKGGQADARAVHASREGRRSRGDVPGRGPGRRASGALERGADSSLPRLPSRCRGEARPVPSALGLGAVLGAGSVDRESADQRAVGDGCGEVRVPCGVPAPAVPGAGERLVRVAPHAGGEGADLDPPGGRAPVQLRGAVGSLGGGRVPEGELHDPDVPGRGGVGTRARPPAGDRGAGGVWRLGWPPKRRQSGCRRRTRDRTSAGG